MNNLTNRPPSRLPGCSVLPPMEPARHRPASTANSKASEKPKGPKSKMTEDRFVTINAFVDFSLGSLTRSETAVWLILWRDERDGFSRTSMADMARRLKIDRRTAIRAVGQLQKRGLLEIIIKGTLNRGPSTYRVKPMEPTNSIGDRAMPS